MSELPVELAIIGPAAPPRSNGEMVFDAPWESRLFGVTMALVEAERFSWSEFQQRLIASVGRRTNTSPRSRSSTSVSRVA